MYLASGLAFFITRTPTPHEGQKRRAANKYPCNLGASKDRTPARALMTKGNGRNKRKAVMEDASLGKDLE